MAWFGDTKVGRIGRFFGNRPSLVGYWQFNGSSIDNSGNGNNGSDSNVAYLGGNFGRAAYFNGSAYITLPGTGFPTGDNPFTLAAWVYLTSYPSGVRDTAIMIGVSSGSSHNSGGIQIMDSSGHLGFGSNYNDYTSSLVVPLFTWTLVAVTYAGSGSGVLYMNNSSEAFTVSSLVLPAGGAIGTVPGALIWNWNGYIADPAVLSEVLPSSLIAQYYAWATRKPGNWVQKVLLRIFSGAASVSMMNAASRFATVQRAIARARSAAVTMMNAASRFATALHGAVWLRSASVSMMNSVSRYATASWHKLIVWTRTASVSMMNSASRFAKAAKTLIIKISSVIRWDFFTWD